MVGLGDLAYSKESSENAFGTKNGCIRRAEFDGQILYPGTTG